MSDASSPKRLSSRINQLDMLTYLAAMANEMTILASQAKQDTAVHHLRLAAILLNQSVQDETLRVRRPGTEPGR